jgi:hypothetical protein
VKIFTVFCLLIAFLQSLSSQDLNYRDLFGEDWKKAAAFEKENRNWIEPVLNKNQISYPLAMSIIFPEIVRYSAVSDKIEITLLKTLYVNLGDDYADFSIGIFQMKPSFAELIRKMAPEIIGYSQDTINFQKNQSGDITDFRKSVIADLENPKIQIVYLIAFIKICEKNFNTPEKDEFSRVRFLATAYNSGFNKTEAEIESKTGKKFFNTKLYRTENYCYADVSLFWYKEFISGL